MANRAFSHTTIDDEYRTYSRQVVERESTCRQIIFSFCSFVCSSFIIIYLFLWTIVAPTNFLKIFYSFNLGFAIVLITALFCKLCSKIERFIVTKDNWTCYSCGEDLDNKMMNSLWNESIMDCPYCGTLLRKEDYKKRL